MSPELHRSTYEARTDYPERIEAILNRPVAPENIDQYADDALDSLIDVAHAAVDDYKHQPTYSYTDSFSLETAAFSYFQLNDIESILDFVSTKADEIRQIDTIIDQASVLPTVIVPPLELHGYKTGSGNGIEPKKFIPRLKTTLFILSNEFDIDLTDPDQITITAGTNTDGMIRDESYYFIDATGLQRTIMICDEEGNSSYVFDTAKLSELELSQERLQHLTKVELNALLQENPTLGQRLIYSDKFTSNMLGAIIEPTTIIKNDGNAVVPGQKQHREITLKVPVGKAPEDYATMNSLRLKFGVSQDIIERAVKVLQATEQLGEDTYYLFDKNHSYRGYSPADQAAISDWMEKNWTNVGPTPEDVLSVTGLSNFFGISPQSIIKAISDLRATGVIGEERKYKFVPRITVGLDPYEQNSVFDWLNTNLLLTPLASEEQISLAGLSKWLGVTLKPVSKVIAALQDRGEMGELPINRFSGNLSQSVSPWDQNAIRDELIRTGIISQPAPEGCLSLFNLAQVSRVSPKKMQAVIATLEADGTLEAPKYYKFGSRSAIGYTGEQRAVIDEYLEQNGLTAEVAPDGYLSLFGISKDLGVSRSTIQISMDAMNPDDLGPTIVYRFDAMTTKGYSPEQQSHIRSELEARGLFKVAPQDFLTISSVAKTLGRDPGTVQKAIDRLEASGELGDVSMYSFTGKILRGYSPEQQQILAEALKDHATNHIIRAEAEVMPEEYKVATHLAKLTGISAERLSAIAKAINPEQMGKVRRFMVDNVARNAFSPLQQELILAEASRRGWFATVAPEDYITATALRTVAKVSQNDLRDAIDSIEAATLGSVERYRFANNTNPAYAFSPEQQTIILDRIAEIRAIEGWAPENFESIPSFAKKLGLATVSIEKVLKSPEAEKLGAIKIYKFRTKRTLGFSPEQQTILTEILAMQGVLVPAAPENVLTRNRIAKTLGRSLSMVTKAVEALDAAGELGAPRSYRFEKAPRPFRGFSPAEQKRIEDWLTGRK